MTTVLLAFLILSPAILAALYPIAVQYERGGVYRVLLPMYAAAGITSTLVNYTWLSLVLLEWPLPKEVTTSQRCERLVFESGFKGRLARAIATYTNWFDPTGPHIPLK
jgi:hypothetical protein